MMTVKANKDNDLKYRKDMKPQNDKSENNVPLSENNNGDSSDQVEYFTE